MTILSNTSEIPAEIRTAHRQSSRVVVGIGDHPGSLQALRAAAREAAYRGGDVLAVHVWLRSTYDGYPVRDSNQGSMNEFLLGQLQQIRTAVLGERAAQGEPPVVITLDAVEGATTNELRRAASGAALLVLGHRHHHGLLGSVTRACIIHPPCAIMIIDTI